MTYRLYFVNRFYETPALQEWSRFYTKSSLHMLAKVMSAAVVGLDAVPIEVEIDIASQGLPSFTIVGLPDKAVEEAKERVRAAIRNSGADFPSRRITVNLAPADLPKEGPSYDLPIAIGILLASGQLVGDISDAMFTGELALDGSLRHTPGMLSHALLAQAFKFQRIFLPSVNAKEAAIISDIAIYPVPSLLSLFYHMSGQKQIVVHPPTTLKDYQSSQVFSSDFSDIRGQEKAKRAFEIAAAGGHNILLKGPPGAGKTLLARTLSSILPTLTFSETLEVTKIYSTAGLLEKNSLITQRPFRSPHHTTSHIGLIGGGTTPKPGEVSLSHRGVLFLDEFPEFPRQVLEALRQPIEDGYVTVSRASGRTTFPAKTMLVAAQNPCPCGYLGSTTHHCSCSASQILRYQKKISGPLLDRIDIHLDVPAVEIEKFTQNSTDTIESSEIVRKRVQKARDRQEKRFKDSGITSNAEMSSKQVKNEITLSTEAQQLLKQALIKLHLSARSYYRSIKVAQTIADLANSPTVETEHIAEALQYRPQTVMI